MVTTNCVEKQAIVLVLHLLLDTINGCRINRLRLISLRFMKFMALLIRPDSIEEYDAVIDFLL